MEDPLSPSELEDASHQVSENPLCELAVVEKMLLKFEQAQVEDFLSAEFSRRQLRQTKSDLRHLTNQMGGYRRSFQAMRSWQMHLLVSYNQLVAQNSCDRVKNGV